MVSSLTLAYALIALGFMLLLAELFIPSSGVLSVLAITALVVGVVLTFAHGTTTGLITLVSVMFALPIVAGVLLYYWPRTSVGRRMFLARPEKDVTMASMPVNLELERLRGRLGRAVSPLRPAGVTDFDGRRVDTITEGMMVEPGQLVRCVDVRAGKVVVRAVDPMDLGALETMELG